MNDEVERLYLAYMFKKTELETLREHEKLMQKELDQLSVLYFKARYEEYGY